MTQDSNIMELINSYENIQIFHIYILVVTFKMTSCKTMSKNKNENQDSMGKTNLFFLAPCPLALGYS
jgi:hypothetical protein